MALAGFRRYRWEVIEAGTTISGSTMVMINTIHMAYCKATGDVCPGIDNYPSVGEGQILSLIHISHLKELIHGEMAGRLEVVTL